MFSIENQLISTSNLEKKIVLNISFYSVQQISQHTVIMSTQSGSPKSSFYSKIFYLWATIMKSGCLQNIFLGIILQKEGGVRNALILAAD